MNFPLATINYLYKAFQEFPTESFNLNLYTETEESISTDGGPSTIFYNALRDTAFVGLKLPNEYRGKRIRIIGTAATFRCAKLSLTNFDRLTQPIISSLKRLCSDGGFDTVILEYNIPASGEFSLGFTLENGTKEL